MKKSLPILALALALAIIAILVTQKPNTSPSPESPSNQKILPNLQPDKVSQISILGPDGNTTLSLLNGTWSVTDRDNYPANSSLIRSLILSLWNSKTIQPVQLGQGSEARLRLSSPLSQPPPPTSEMATLVRLFDSSASLISEILIGNERSPESFSDSSTATVGRYLLVPGQKFASLVTDNLPYVSSNPASWLDKSFIKISSPISIERTGSQPWKVIKQNNQWQPDPPTQHTFQQNLISAAISMWTSSTFDDLAPTNSLDEVNPDDHIIITESNGWSFTIQRGNATDGRTPVKILAREPLPTQKSHPPATPQPSPTQTTQPNPEPITTHQTSESPSQQKEPAPSTPSPEPSPTPDSPPDPEMLRRLENRVFLLPTSFVDSLFISKESLFTKPEPSQQTEAVTPPVTAE